MANPIPALKFTAFDSAGDPLSGGKLYTYDAGTTTPRATYTDSGLGTPNANPVILNSRGEADVWLSGGYKFVLKDSADVTIYTVDNITDALTNTTMSGTLTISSTAVTWSGNPTHSGNHVYSGNVTVQGNTTLGNAGTDTITTTGNVTMNEPTSGYTLSADGSSYFGPPASGITITSDVATGNRSLQAGVISTGTNKPRIEIYHTEASGLSDLRFTGSTSTIAGRISIGSTASIDISTTGNVSITAPASGTTATLTVAALNGAAPLKLGTLTVANLPAAATAGAGAKGFVTDANATTFASVVAGGGANGVPVYSDGTSWRIG